MSPSDVPKAPPVVIKNFPTAYPALIIDNGNTMIAVFCGTGMARTITQGEKTLVILYARCTSA